MFVTILKKEILDGLFTARFVITLILCLTLIPLGIYVNLREYEFRETNHAEALRLHREHVASSVPGAEFEAEAFRRPAVLGLFSAGLEAALPSRAVTSRDGIYRVSVDQGLSNPYGHIFGRLDLLSFVTIVLSLLAFVFTHGTVTGERERGTLRLLLTASASRGEVFFGKLFGNYLLFVTPVLASLAIGFIIIGRSGAAAGLWGHFLPHVVLVVVFTLLFLFCMFCIGMFASTLTRRTGSAIVALIFVWTVLVLTVPRLAPMLAEALLPVRPRQLVDMDKTNARAALEREFSEKYEELYQATVDSRGGSSGSLLVPVDPFMTPDQQEFLAEYRKRAAVMDSAYAARLADTLRVLEREDREASRRQAELTTALSRLSPVGSYAALIGAVTGTGIQEWDRLLEHARAYQRRVEETFYSRWNVLHLGRGLTRTSPAGGTCPPDVDHGVLTAVVPDPPLSAALRHQWVDFGLLVVVTYLACMAGYVRFQHYDAR